MSVPSQESHILNTANPRRNMKIMSSASFSLASVWLANPIKIWRGRQELGVGLMLDMSQMIKWLEIWEMGLIGVSETQYIFDFTFDSQLQQV